MVVLPEHYREGREEEVEIAVHNRHEKRQEQDDRRKYQHLCRTNKGVSPEPACCEAVIANRTQSHISSLALESARLASKDYDTIGLPQEDVTSNRDCPFLLAFIIVSCVGQGRGNNSQIDDRKDSLQSSGATT